MLCLAYHTNMHDTSGPLRHTSTSTLFLRCLYCHAVGEDPFKTRKRTKHVQHSTIFQGQCVVLINPEDQSDLTAHQHVCHLHDPPSPVPNMCHCLLTANMTHRMSGCTGSRKRWVEPPHPCCFYYQVSHTHTCTEREPESPPTQHAL